MAPEQTLLVRTDPRSDIFALGTILYHLIAGRPPFGSPASDDGLRRRIYQDPVPPRSVNPSCPDWLQEVILGCIEVDPARRFQEAGEVAFLLRNPGKVQLTRAARGKPGGLFAAFSRQDADRESGREGPALHRQGELTPTVMAAVDLSSGSEPLAEALRTAVRRTWEFRGAIRLRCVAVHSPFKLGEDAGGGDHAGRNLHALQLAELRNWALPLGLPAELVSFHVLEADDAAAALIGFARENRVGHVVIGAGGTSALRGLLGSVASKVVAESFCTVTVVRAHHSAESQ